MAFDVTENVIPGRGTREADYEQLRANFAHLKVGTPFMRWTPQGNIHLPSSSPAGGPVARNDHQVLAFDKNLVEHCWLHGVLPESYQGGDLSVGIYWATPTLTTGSVVWQTVMCRLEQDVDDLDVDTFGTGVVVADSALGTAGFVKSHANVHGTAAERDNLAPGDAFAIRLGRVGTNGSDTLDEDAHLLRATLRESTPGTVGIYDETDLAAVGGSLRRTHWKQLFDMGQALQSGNPFRCYLEPELALPATNPAQRTTRGSHPILAFDDTTEESAYVQGGINSFAGSPRDGSINGLTVDLWWAAATASSGSAVWFVSIEKWLPDVGNPDIDGGIFFLSVEETTATASSPGELVRTRLKLLNAGLLLEELAEGMAYRLLITRKATGNSVTGDVHLFCVAVGQMAD